MAKVELGDRLHRSKSRRKNLSTNNTLTFVLAVQHQVPLSLLFVVVHVSPIESVGFQHLRVEGFDDRT